MAYTAATKYPSNTVLTVFTWSRPGAENPRIAQPVSSTATTLTFTNAPKDRSGVVLTSGFLMNAKDNNGYSEVIYVPAGALSADGLTATGVVRGIRPEGLDYTTGDSSFAVDLPQDAPVGCAVAQTYHRMMIAALQGDIGSGANNWKIGDATDSNITVYAFNADTNKPFWRYDAATNQWVFSNDGVSSTPFGTGAGVTGGDGIAVTAGDIDVDLTDTTVFVSTSSGAGDSGKVARLNASGKYPAGFLTGVDIQTFTSSDTWTKPTGAAWVQVICIGAGGSGGGGEGGGAGTARAGGSAGGGATKVEKWFKASDLGATVTVTVAPATIGGAGGVNTDGTEGVIGGNSSFGTHVIGYGGGKGAGGQSLDICGGTGAGTGGAGLEGGVVARAGGAPSLTASTAGIGGGGGGCNVATAGTSAEFGGGSGGGTATAGTVGLNGGTSVFGAGGGGSGGGLTVGNAASNGGAGGAVNTWTTAGGGGGTAGTAAGPGGNGADGDSTKCGQGGGGGASNASGTGGAGGNGGTPGGGGGGGAAGTNTGGAGGNGGRGEVRVVSYY